MVKDCTVAEQHPCTQGHFPGYPIVPGAYLMALVEQLVLEDHPAMRVAMFRKVKFLSSLTPGTKAQLDYRLAGERKVQFGISTASGKIMEGSLLLEVV